jgi:hypothetical protein
MHSRSSLAHSIQLDPLVRIDPSLQTAASKAGASKLVSLNYLPISEISPRVSAQGGDKSGGYSLDRESPSSRRRHRTEVKSGFAIQPSSGRNEIAAVRMGSGIYIQVGETLLLLEVVM